MGSDWSVSTPNPLLEMEVAVERVSDLDRGEKPPLLPDERLDLMDALAAFTTGSAYVMLVDLAKNPAISGGGVYNDVIVKTAAGWKFKKRSYFPEAAQ